MVKAAAAGAFGKPAGSEDGAVFEGRDPFCGGVFGAGQSVVHPVLCGVAGKEEFDVVRAAACAEERGREVFGEVGPVV